ncbi:hypothetical protein E308F_27830 [Moorella sp. E308F]|jgi:uncharacterized membrane protein YqiK|nr:hypothetical protein E308F_27830 [Moorella sp. E308F]GEA17267.1 hypothetical protein E306M_04010 [Moorella sp. E306M]
MLMPPEAPWYAGFYNSFLLLIPIVIIIVFGILLTTIIVLLLRLKKMQEEITIKLDRISKEVTNRIKEK